MAFGQQDRVKYKERLRIMQRSVPNWISMVYLKVFRVFEKYELGVLNMTNFKSVARVKICYFEILALLKHITVFKLKMI